jgi:hypothetical protein
VSDTERKGCLSLLTGSIAGKRASQVTVVLDDSRDDSSYQYRVRDDFLSRAEFAFYSALRAAVGDRAVICPKVRIADLLFDPHQRGWSGGFNKISQRHVDFVLCDPVTMHPLAAIELDDRSHEREDRQDRDAEVDAAFQSARFPLARFPVQTSYDLNRIWALLEPVFAPYGSSQNTGAIPGAQPAHSPVSPPPSSVPPNRTSPLCPKCGVPMVIRVVSKGANEGKKFYGCRNFPACREMKAYSG